METGKLVVGRRDAPILVLFSKAERALMKASATAAGLGTGPWLRSLGLREARKFAAKPVAKEAVETVRREG